uniref:Putative tick salivary peptide group 1 n=1 Tax=Ixodes ricinus TaxID=34613 RepID=V5GL67_IXORI
MFKLSFFLIFVFAGLCFGVSSEDVSSSGNSKTVEGAETSNVNSDGTSDSEGTSGQGEWIPVPVGNHILAEISTAMMGLTGITLVLASLAFFGSVAADDCRNGTRPSSQNDRGGCDFYCWNEGTRSYDQYFFTDGVELSFLLTNWLY